MSTLSEFLAETLVSAPSKNTFYDSEAIRQRFVRDRLDWITSEIKRGGTLHEISQTLGVPVEVLDDALWMRALQSLLPKGNRRGHSVDQ